MIAMDARTFSWPGSHCESEAFGGWNRPSLFHSFIHSFIHSPSLGPVHGVSSSLWHEYKIENRVPIYLSIWVPAEVLGPRGRSVSSWWQSRINLKFRRSGVTKSVTFCRSTTQNIRRRQRTRSHHHNTAIITTMGPPDYQTADNHVMVVSCLDR